MAVFKTVHAKLLVPIICVLIIGSLVSGIIGHRAASGVIIDAFREDGQRSASNLRANMDMELSKAQLDLLALSIAPSVKYLLMNDEASESLVEGYIMALVAQHAIYNSITILNTEGYIVSSTSGSTGGYRGDRGYFLASLKGEFYISRGVEMSRQTGALTVFVSIPVRDFDENEIIGVALVVIRLEELSARHVIPVNLLGDHGFAMVVTGDGRIIAHPDETQIIAPDEYGERPPHAGMVTEATLLQLQGLIGDSAVIEATRDGESQMLFVERSQYTDWFAIVVCPVSEFYEQSNWLAVFNTLLALTLIIVQAGIIWVIVRGITKALTVTVRYSQAVSKGALDSALSVEREDEVGVLAQSLRDMVGELKNMISIAEKKTAEAEAATELIMESINYASKIQKNLLPSDTVFKKSFSDYHVIWEPRDVVGGDIYWAKNFNDGTVLCVCDCTGHGTPGALLTMLVVSAFESIIKEERHTDTAEILYLLDRRLAAVLNVDSEKTGKGGITDIKDGCDLAVLFIANNGHVTLSSGNTHVFVCDGSEVTRYKGQSVFVGEGRIKNKESVKVQQIPVNPENKFYITSDGLSDQIGGNKNRQWGYKNFSKIVLESHHESQALISEKIWNAFQDYQDEQPRRDDFSLITFKPKYD
jgi:serine phosphatase RsbU (regulator of sigma subunit)